MIKQMQGGLARIALDRLERFAANVSGNVALTTCLSAPMVMACLGLATDYAMMTTMRTGLQSAADAAAIAAAREVSVLANGSGQTISIAKAYALRALQDNAGGELAANYALTAVHDAEAAAVKVTISQEWTPFFAHFVKSGVTPVTATATARYAGSSNICVLAVSSDAGKGVFLDHDGAIVARNCGVFSNSRGKDAVRADANARIEAKIICSAGGHTAATSRSFVPTPVTDCPEVEDPLRARALPRKGSCSHKAREVKDASVTLRPGVYCEGLKIAGTAKVTFEPGTYFIDNGTLLIQDEASVHGDGVTFVFTGPNAMFDFTENTSIRLWGAKSGDLAGVLFFEDRATASGKLYRIASNDAKTLVGTFYLPKGTLQVNAKAPVAGDSAYTAIIAHRIEILERPTLMLNSDYSLTDVPVPAGIAGVRKVVLSE